MSGNVRFNAITSSTAAAKKLSGKPKPILPQDFLMSLHGRRVVVFLSYKDHELEGKLVAVDADKGDVFLDDVVHYAWSRGTGDRAKVGTREVIRRCGSAMVNSRYVELISPQIIESA